MKKEEQLYFENEDSCFTQSLDELITEAKEDGLNKITIIKAEKDIEKQYVWCEAFAEVKERNECSKKCCTGYEKPPKGNICADRGTLYWHGEKVTFNVVTSEQII